MDFLSVTKYLKHAKIYISPESLCRDVSKKKKYYFGLVAMVTTQSLLLAKHVNKRNYKTKHRMLGVE